MDISCQQPSVQKFATSSAFWDILAATGGNELCKARSIERLGSASIEVLEPARSKRTAISIVKAPTMGNYCLQLAYQQTPDSSKAAVNSIDPPYHTMISPNLDALGEPTVLHHNLTALSLAQPPPHQLPQPPHQPYTNLPASPPTPPH